MNYKLVIFDCDGVLVDSERITNTLLTEMLNEYGLSITLTDAVENFSGLSLAQCLEKITCLFGVSVSDDFVTLFRQRMQSAFASQLTAVPGIFGVLNSLTLPYCVASNGDEEKIRFTLTITGLLPYFEGKIFSTHNVKNPKPAPDIFLYAAQQCGFMPENCVVIEDTPTGVMASIAAKMSVLGYAGLTPASYLYAAGAHDVFDNMDELLQRIDLNISEKQ